jgi:hypothetical protein
MKTVDEAESPAADAPAAPAVPDMPNMASHDGYHDYARVDLSHLTKEERKARNAAIKTERYEKRKAYQKDQVRHALCPCTPTCISLMRRHASCPCLHHTP